MTRHSSRGREFARPRPPARPRSLPRRRRSDRPGGGSGCRPGASANCRRWRESAGPAALEQADLAALTVSDDREPAHAVDLRLRLLDGSAGPLGRAEGVLDRVNLDVVADDLTGR